MDSGYGILNTFAPCLLSIWSSIIWRFCMGVFWYSLRLLLRVVHIGQDLTHTIFCYSISNGLINKYKNLDLHNLRCLAVVIDSEDAKNIGKIKKLLHSLSKIGAMNVILYDTKGVLKKYMASSKLFCNAKTTCFDADRRTVTLILHGDQITIEFLSFSDNKEIISKAANFLCSRQLKSNLLAPHKIEPVFTDTDLLNALKMAGCGGLHPDLLLVYGPARCHLGFPAWRLRYTEIIYDHEFNFRYMGPLKSMKHGAIVKAVYDFSNRNKN
ncbi:dehydrodolichyl diphosphate synthase complex subunit NUS1-like isoform X2 [Dioscorea cayenensis subsp. rotundata]|uniref:ditrans,polycis-polyprenyl diphosphate synthase [(2E,6E)-farnesyldiphosphate specific] n=1 Tax=Dioscorea cayennensis subsp. rotundata TaxID=55577 RepID=A0AB40AKQ0_DIOCR|nr:dehydrodolichyl diphosphate synthase complex subunit NUS1-like isoform X2 [Dioscorea cayenensis subsp. rotundata]